MSASRSADAVTSAPASCAAAVSAVRSCRAPSIAGYCTRTPNTSAPPAAARSSSAVVTRGEVGDDDRDAQRHGAGAHHPEGLREHLGVDEQHGIGRGLARAAHQGHRLGRGRRLVEQRGPRDRQAGEVADDGLEVEQGLEPALGDLGLVGRVGGVPGGVLEHVALHHGRRQRAVVAEPDHRGDPAVAGGHLAQLLEHGGLGRGRLDVERLRATDAARHRGVDEVGERAAADDLEHRGDVVLARADVAGRERGQVGGGGAHGRLLKADGVDASPSVTVRRGAGSSRGACPVWSLAPERFRGGLPLRRPDESRRGLSHTV